jgi:hypothetical protein
MLMSTRISLASPATMPDIEYAAVAEIRITSPADGAKLFVFAAMLCVTSALE